LKNQLEGGEEPAADLFPRFLDFKFELVEFRPSFMNNENKELLGRVKKYLDVILCCRETLGLQKLEVSINNRSRGLT
jgi:hypothetical protein